MNRIHSLFQVALLLLLVVGCGAEFQGTAGDGGEAGSGEPQAGAPSAGAGGASGSGGSAGGAPRGGASGSGGTAGSGVAGTAGAAGAGGIAEPSCSPAEAVLELAGMTFTLDEYEWTDISNCASCPPGGCTTCTVESAHIDVFPEGSTPMGAIGAVLWCDSAILAGPCDGEKALCIEQSTRSERTGQSTFSGHVNFTPKPNGYEIMMAGQAASPEGQFRCSDATIRDKIVSLFEEQIANGSFLRCD